MQIRISEHLLAVKYSRCIHSLFTAQKIAKNVPTVLPPIMWMPLVTGKDWIGQGGILTC